MIEAIQALQSASIGTEKVNKAATLTSDTSFMDALDAAKKLIQATNESEQEAKVLTYDFLTGKNDNIHSLLIAQEKSSIMLNFTLQVRNQLIDAYKEIMRLNI
ncbi:flagellar hook-basal body complex protein FliE [Sporanaerobium hydrogeniformans]|uniref:Flagellar hook-basal body complex protein FliE n=1 Tax=Sporanaerobium hydrogeniformans TaxID=3072179 RepID=A0AC61DFZ9_9FIRM|nr:flagellar hook-basal body complex protein FliE [Sporanaerobium hydrogeniformans]PHV71738.1 flagellar hook-basal body complex protein FliE [Sporanaerobium hydrogeniformans]